jgi:UDP-glucose 4-epimerase
MKNKLVGITGSRGVLGKILVKKLSLMKQFKYSCFEGNITVKEDVKKWIINNNFNYIIHLAAIVPTERVKNDFLSALKVNVMGTKNLLEELNSQAKNPWFFYASTSHVYKSKNSPINETDFIEPITEYGLSKYAGEIIAKKNYTQLCIGRIFSFYHDSQKIPFLYPTIKKRLEEEDVNKEFLLRGANSIRDFLNAEEVTDIIIKLMNKNSVGTYNIGSGKGIKIKDFVQNMTDYKLKIKNVGKSDYLIADVTKIKNLNK